MTGSTKELGTEERVCIKEQPDKTKNLPRLLLRDSSRGDRIRTCDPLVPNQMRYQLRYTPNNGNCPKTALFHRMPSPSLTALCFSSRRGDRIRTCDPLVPNQMRYQLRYTPKTLFSFYFIISNCLKIGTIASIALSTCSFV